MKKIISFEKKLEFPSMVGEITSISLEHTLQFLSPSSIEGAFLITGTYKLTEASCIEDNFNFKIPTEILLNEKLDTSTAKIEIDDFYYEIENEENLICYIDILVEGIEEIEIDINPQPIEEPIIEENSTRECDGDLHHEPEVIDEILEDVEDEILEEKEQEIMDKEEQEPRTSSLFANLKDDEDTFITYSVYILQQEETLQTVMEKYKITKDELEEYNDLSNIITGSKIIIPYNENNK